MDVMLVDDSALMRRLLRTTLERRGHHVAAVGDGGAAGAAFERLQPPLVILDWHMPRLDAVEAYRSIRRRQRLTCTSHPFPSRYPRTS